VTGEEQEKARKLRQMKRWGKRKRLLSVSWRRRVKEEEKRLKLRRSG
jgi:hypothetical protein